MELFGFEIPTSGILISLTIISLCIYSTWAHGVFKRVGIPGPKPWPFLGHIISRTLHREEFAWELRRKYGKVSGFYEFTQPVIQVSDPEIIKHIMITDFSSFVNRMRIPVFDPPIDKGIALAENEDWKRLRKITSPVFTSGKLRLMTNQINTCADVLVMNLEEYVGKPVKFLNIASSFTLDVITRFAFGIETNSQQNPDDAIVKNVRKFFSVSPFKIGLAFAFPRITGFLQRLGFQLFWRESIAFFSRLMDRLIADRKDDKQKRPVDFMQLMLNAHEEVDAEETPDKNSEQKPKAKQLGMTQEELMAQMVIFTLAGTNTTAGTLTYLCYSLAVNPEIQEMLVSQIDSDISNLGFLTPEDCAKVPYLRQCINETLRIYPTLRCNSRVCSKDTVINGVHFPAGAFVEVSLAVMHMDPEYWKEPEKFNPDRFSPEEQASRDPLLWQPFGTGPRDCIGRRLGLMVLEIAIVKLLKKFRFLTCPETEIPIRMNGTPRTEPIRPVTFRVERRS